MKGPTAGQLRPPTGSSQADLHGRGAGPPPDDWYRTYFTAWPSESLNTLSSRPPVLDRLHISRNKRASPVHRRRPTGQDAGYVARALRGGVP